MLMQVIQINLYKQENTTHFNVIIINITRSIDRRRLERFLYKYENNTHFIKVQLSIVNSNIQLFVGLVPTLLARVIKNAYTL